MTQAPLRTQDPLKTARKVTRLEGFDYSSEGAYFITLVTKNRERLFGVIVDEEMVLNDFGRVVDCTWNNLINHNTDMGLGEFCIMPNHVHGIIHLYGKREISVVGVGSQPTPVFHQAGFPETKALPGAENVEPAPTISSQSLSEIVRQIKTFSARRINALRGTPKVPVWQRSFYDHIIGTDREYLQIKEYILENPRKWAWDEENKS